MNGFSGWRHNGVTSRLAMSCAIFVFVLIAVGLVGGKENNADLRRIDSIYPEQACLGYGGICVVATDCPDGHLAEQRGLCPEQKSQGIECCYGISMKETRCVRHGGTCMLMSKSYCNPRLVYDGATDCLGETRCCIMV